MKNRCNRTTRHVPRPLNDRHPIRLGTLAIAMALSLQATSATAQQNVVEAADTDNMSLEEVVVTAQRKTELLRDVPISMTIFSADDLLMNDITGLAGYLMKTPNVSFVESGTRGEREVSIRGVHNIGGQVSAIAFYVDEFNMVNGPSGSNTSNSSVNPHLYDIERVEVLRGPQGTFFGRNATGGAINITTKKPEPGFYSEVTGKVASFDTYSAGAVLNIPVAETLFLRGSVYYEQGEGYVRNVNPVGGRSDTEYMNLRGAVRWVPTEQLTIDVSVNYMDDKQGLAENVATGVLSGSSAGLLAAMGIFDAIDEGIGFYPENQHQVNNDLKGFHSSEYAVTVARIEWDAGPVTVTSVTGYFDATHEFMKDMDFTSNDWLRFDNDVSSETFSTEMRLASNSDGAIDWLIGGMYAEDELHKQFGVRAGAGDFLGLPENFPIDTGDEFFQTKSYAFFGNVTWHVNDRWALMLGGRYSNDEVSQEIAGINFGRPDVPGQGEESFDDFSPRFATTYDINNDVTLYGTISKGYKAGGLQLNVTQNLPVATFGEEYLWNYEAGIRFASAGGRVRANMSVFYMDWQDLQVSTEVAVIDPDTNEITFINTTTNAASSSIYGAEFDINAALTERLTLGGGVGYLNASFDNFPNAVVNGEVTDLTGYDLPQAPKWTLNANSQYTIPFENDWQGFGRVEWTYRDESISNIDSLLEQGFPFISEAFQVWNFRVGAESEKYRLEAYVENAFGEEYFTTTSDFGFAGIQIHPAERFYGFRFLVRIN